MTEPERYPYGCVCDEEWCFCTTTLLLTDEEADAAQRASGEAGNMGTCDPCKAGQHVWSPGGKRDE